MKPIVIGAALAAAVGGAYAGVNWYTGQQVESRLAKQYEEIDALPLVAVKDRRYQRSLTGATEEVTFALGCPKTPIGAAMAGIEVTVRNRIKHGPFTGDGMAAAKIDTEIVIPPAIAAQLAKVFGDRPPLSISTRVAFNGSRHSTLEVPSARINAADLPGGEGGALAWQGMTAVADTDASGDHLQYRWDVRGLMFSDGKGTEMKIGPAVVEGTGKRVLSWLYDDDSRFRIESIEMTVPSTVQTMMGQRPSPFGSLVFKDISGTGRMKVDNNYLGETRKMEVGSLVVDARPIGKLNYDTSFDRVHLPTIVKAAQSLLAGNAFDCDQLASGEAARQLPAMLDKLKGTAFELLSHSPRVSVDRLGVTLPEGEAKIGYQVVLGAITEADLAAPEQMMRKLTVTANASVAQDLVGRFATMAMQQAGVTDAAAADEIKRTIAQNIDPLVAQGMIMREGGNLTAAFEMKEGQFKLNGKVIEVPMAAALGAIGAASADDDDEDDEPVQAAPAPRGVRKVM